MKKITDQTIKDFKAYLMEEEKSKATQEKYVHDVTAFCSWLGGAALTKAKVLEYKEHIITKYAPASVNAILSSLNRFFAYAVKTAESRTSSIRIRNGTSITPCRLKRMWSITKPAV